MDANLIYASEEYRQACEMVPVLIEQSGRTQKWYYEQMGLSRTAFERRLKENNWKPEQLQVLDQLIKSQQNTPMTRVKTLGSGGFGVVSLYRASNNEYYAVKHMQNSWNQDSYQRFVREIQILDRVQNHPNVMSILNYDLWNGAPYYVMPYCRNGSLRDRIISYTEQGYVHSLAAASGIIYYLAQALDFAHTQEVIHRDLKPENILFQGRKPIIADWGIGKFLNARDKELTKGGIGTPGYCAPEQWHKAEANSQSDIFSLGLIYRELLTGSPYGKVENPQVRKIIDTMTAPNPGDRYHNMKQVLYAIRQIQVVEHSSPMKDFWGTAASIAIGASIGIGVFFLLRELLD